MGRVIEAKAVLTGEDRTGGMFKAVGQKMKDLGKGMKMSAEFDKLNRQLADHKRGLEAIERLRRQQDSFGASRARYRTAQDEVGRIARELAAAKAAAAQFDGIKAFSKNRGIGKEIGEARRRVTELEGALKGARREVSSASGAFEAQATALKATKRDAEGAGVAIGRLASGERRLKAAIDSSSFAIEKRANHERNFGGAVASGAGAAVGRSASRRAHPAEGGGLLGEAGLGLTGGAAMRFGLGAAGAAGGAVMFGDAMRKSYQSAMSFERALIEVGKATDTSGKDLDAYGERILKLSRETGKTKEELASMVSSAGFAGRPKDELMDFAEYASKATVAWNTSAEETGQAMAELGNIYGANQKRIEEIGDAINTMADNSASKETDLLEFLRRAGASGKQAGIAAEQMLAFGAAMKEVGVRNEVAGTGMEAFLNVMKLGAEFSKHAKDGLKALGVDSDKMRRAFVAKPVETMIDLLEKLNKVSDPLKKAEIMTDLFGKEYQDDMAKPLNALPQINKYVGTMNDKAQLAKGGVRLQFAQNVDKDVMKIDRATAAIDTLYRRIGEPIKIQAGGVAEEISPWMKKLEEGDSVAQRLIKRLTPEAAPKSTEPQPRPYSPLGDASTRLLGLVDPEMAEAGRKDRAEQRALAVPGHKREVNERISAMEDDIAATRRTMARTGRSQAQIDAVLRPKITALKEARRSRASLEAELPTGIAPSRPITTASIPSLIDAPYKDRPALPFPQRPTQAPRPVWLPPARARPRRRGFATCTAAADHAGRAARRGRDDQGGDHRPGGAEATAGLDRRGGRLSEADAGDAERDDGHGEAGSDHGARREHPAGLSIRRCEEPSHGDRQHHGPALAVVHDRVQRTEAIGDAALRQGLVHGRFDRRQRPRLHRQILARRGRGLARVIWPDVLELSGNPLRDAGKGSRE